MIYLSRRIGFSSAHRYYQKKFSEDENKKIFGRCYTEHGHGHNYILEITLGGEPDPDTGMVINLTDVDHVLKAVTDPLDHQHLNFDIPYFKEVVPTTENLARYCYDGVKKLLTTKVKLVRVRLFENPELWSDYYG
ncbi:MAG: 6-carboxytetrahydropterin synthase [Oligoflexia bacterium]|nr:6-carboxytetrahydropterin synthase [Oligoflexia bacterium]